MQEIRHEHNWKQASKYITIHKVSQHVPTKASKIHSSSKTNTPNCTTIKFNTINLLSAHNQKFQRPPFFFRIIQRTQICVVLFASLTTSLRMRSAMNPKPIFRQIRSLRGSVSPGTPTILRR
ncbi:hypothetical protein H4I96_04100 [Botrytis cinerea]